ncbi:GrpB family protein [Pseudomonas stutzeri]|uniref:GrpB family protein n=1 Tax=Stutzerimonas stutzeri TaxID=316 RepID=A0A2N8S6C1_STUST|nr:GrpB family protein [Stutzerimonas stutzeri]MCQ4297670.1 GrpB family protein [Stutzerimonas stutzeri]PNF82170.1 GrpB family protein [Stutzerimonas stutzeri]
MTEEESLLAAIHEEVKLHAYQASWPRAYDLERDRLLSLFPDTFQEIQHIGSTAVPGLSAKPIIDMLAGVQSIATAERLALPLCQSGYTTSSEFNDSLSDRKWFMRWADGHRTHHLHLVVHDSCVWHERLRFRDALRASPALAARYAALKKALAAAHPKDRDAYTDAKTDFIRTVLLEA